MDMAGKIKKLQKNLDLGFIYKTSFDKANSTSLKGQRGAGLEILHFQFLIKLKKN